MGHRRSVLVFKNVNYGASKASTTLNTALNPADLADGAVGIYGIHETGATNLNKLVLLTDGGSEVAGAVPAASFVGKEIFICQGVPLTAGGSAVRLSTPIGYQPFAGIQKCGALAYVAPIRGISRIGWNGTVGSSLNFPATVLRGDDNIVSIFNRNYGPAPAREPGQKVLLSSQSAAGDSAYVTLTKFVAQQQLRSTKNPIGDQLLIDVNLLRIVSNGTGTAFANTATATVTKGSTAVTTSAVHGVTANQWILLGGDLYQAVAIPTTSSITLDRVYQGVSAVISNANAINTGSTTIPTQLGLEFIDNADGRNIELAVQGNFQNATVTRVTRPSPGSGSNAEVVAMEKEFLGKKGSEDQITTFQPLDVIYSRGTGLNYDLYDIEVHNHYMAKGDQGSVFRIQNYIICAFPAGIADTAGFNQANFENIMQSLYTTARIPSIS